MYKIDMKAFKTAMKLIVESQITQPVEFRINKNNSEFVSKDESWRVVIPFECESDIENTNIKLSNESFNEIYKNLRATKKEIFIDIIQENQMLKFSAKDEEMFETKYESLFVKEIKTFQNETLTHFKIDDMLSFLNSAFAFKNNKYTPIDKQIEIRFDQDKIKLFHFNSIKMSRLILKNLARKEYRTVIIPNTLMNIAYSLFKNSFEFDGEIQENDSVIIFATKRFKLGLKKEHVDTKPLEHLFVLPVHKEFVFNEEQMNQLFQIKKELKPTTTIKIGEEILELEEGKVKPTKYDLMVQIVEQDGKTNIVPYAYKSVQEIGNKANKTLGFYDFSTLFEISQSFVEPGLKGQILNNHTLRLFNKSETIDVHLLPIVPTNREVLSDDE